MMNSHFLNLERNMKGTKWSIYTGLPYSPRGKDVIKVATWTTRRGLSLAKKGSLFPEKYDNYYGSTINITALPFPPHWIVEEKQHPNGTITETYKGTDAYLLQSIASVLNFTYQNVVVNTWLECEERVSERVAFLSPVYYVILPNRMELHDYTFTYEFMSPAICALKPTVKPQWESLYYPLTNEVWGFTLCVTILVPIVFILGNRFGYAFKFQPKVGDWAVSEIFIGTLLSQAPSSRLPEHNSIRVLVMAWLIFAFIIGAAYRGNLIASLTLSKSPPRPETIDEINKAFDTVLMPPHGNEFKKFFEMPGSAKTFQELARRMVTGTKPLPGLQAALTGKVAYMDGRRFAAHHIAQYFTNADGSTKLYLARENVLAGMSAWAIPHDAPFQPQIDFLMMAAIAGGLYEKWNEDILSEARLESQRRQKKIQEQTGPQETRASDSNVQPFTLVHMQGPFMLLILGLLASTLSFAGEILAKKIM
ncbi:ionotropic receptor 93a-like [Macrobrachium rosenbergii]|uniref:ionotropic receptor 93a-like n=1 Tax=Macrobrachium rosenbergii TaxID=79674 RepID=UPI0034D6A7E7